MPDPDLQLFCGYTLKGVYLLEEAENGVRDLADDVAGEEAAALITVVVFRTSDSDMGSEPAPGSGVVGDSSGCSDAAWGPPGLEWPGQGQWPPQVLLRQS